MAYASSRVRLVADHKFYREVGPLLETLISLSNATILLEIMTHCEMSMEIYGNPTASGWGIEKNLKKY
jgi:hypothetical protein